MRTSIPVDFETQIVKISLFSAWHFYIAFSTADMFIGLSIDRDDDPAAPYDAYMIGLGPLHFVLSSANQ